MPVSEASLPIIDFGTIIASAESNDPVIVQASNAEKERLYRAFIDVGFVYLKNHWVTEEAQQTLFAHAKKFFALSESEKIKIETGESKSFHGWFSPQRTSGNQTHSDQKEAFDIGDDNDPTRPNQWPENWPEFRTDMNDFFEKCHEVHLVLLKVLAQQVGIDENFFEPYVGAKDHFFRIIYYPETTRESFKNRFRATPHTDYGTLTLLFNDQSGGLQVQHANGEYIEAPPIPGHAIINVGDLLSRWFNDNLKSTYHRVVDPPPKNTSNGNISEVLPARYSIAWFGHPNRDALVEPLEQCCTLESPKKYQAVYAGKHVVERLAYLHKKGRNTDSWTDEMQRNQNASHAPSTLTPIVSQAA